MSFDVGSTVSEFRPPTARRGSPKKGGRYAHVTAKVDSFRSPQHKPTAKLPSPEKKLSYVVKRAPAAAMTSPRESASANTLIAELEQNAADARTSPVSPFTRRVRDGRTSAQSQSRDDVRAATRASDTTVEHSAGTCTNVSSLSVEGSSVSVAPPLDAPAAQILVTPRASSPQTEIVVFSKPDVSGSAVVEVSVSNADTDLVSPRPLAPSPMPDIHRLPREQGDAQFDASCLKVATEKQVHLHLNLE